MVLVDSSIWIDHLRSSEPDLLHLMTEEQIVCHPYILGELALGNFRRRDRILAEIDQLPVVTVASHNEVLRFIDHHRLFGLGVGYVDVHLLAAVILEAGTTLWTRDKKLLAAAQKLGINFIF